VRASARGEAAAHEAMAADYGATTSNAGVTAAKSAAAIAAGNSTAASDSTKATAATSTKAPAVTSTKPAAVASSTHRGVTTATSTTSTTAATSAVSATAVLSKGGRAHGQQDRKRTDEKADFGLHITYSDASHRCAPARPRGLTD
jgi:hypothetical protein